VMVLQNVLYSVCLSARMTKETDLILVTSLSKALLKKGYSKEKPSSGVSVPDEGRFQPIFALYYLPVNVGLRRYDIAVMPSFRSCVMAMSPDTDASRNNAVLWSAWAP